MKISTLQKNLKKGLHIVGNITSKNVNLPILNNIKMEVSNKVIRLIATNLEIGVTHSMRGKVDEDGDFIIDGKVFSNYISLLPSKQLNIEKRENKVLIDCDNYKTSINCQVGDEFPLIPTLDKEKYFNIDTAELKKGLSQVMFAVSTNESRIDLSGILFKISAAELTPAATDSYRLAEKKVPILKNLLSTDGEEKAVLVPAKTVQEVVRILSNIGGDEDEIDELNEVKVCISENQILFQIGTTELVSRLIEGQFPDYNQIIPQNIKTEATINKNELARAIKAASLFSQNSINDVLFEFTKKNKVTISSSSGQVGENSTELEVNAAGIDNSLVINYKYILDGLNNIDDEEIRLEIVDKNAPCILKPTSKDRYLYIVMPIKQ